MKLTGDIRKIGTKRDDKFEDISLQINRIEYITHKKDGNYYQAFDLEVELEKPLVITGDRLAKKNLKPSEEGEIIFDIYDKEGDDYVLNKNRELEIIVAYDGDEDLLILSSVYYAEVLPPKEFEALKKEYEKTRAFQNRKGRKR
jgi:hypothetical protein